MDVSLDAVGHEGNLFISDASSARTKKLIEKHKITHIVSVGSHFKPVFQDIQYKIFPIEDDEDEFILECFPEAIEFISTAHQAGNAVLVHCAAGISRSSTIVTAYLMSTKRLGFSEALQFLRNYRPIVLPNIGFQFQLKLFEQMEYKLDPNNQDFKRMKMVVLARQRHIYGQVQSLFQTDWNPEQNSTTGTVEYRCRKCRSALFRQNNIVEHETGAGETSFSWQKRMDDLATPKSLSQKEKENSGQKCSSIFVEPLSWIAGATTGELDGQVLCPKCSAKLGSFNWSGIQCSCGSWVAPAFVIHKSKVDVVKSL